MSKKVLVLGETREGALRNVSFEAIAAAKKISGDGEVVAVLLGEAVSEFGNELVAYGADRVITVEHPHLKSYTSDGYGQ
ncbi:MAG: electron transfer flavoprotein subunit alpha/FixB family protein, partial [Planococcus sp. (in: firmicutes)]|nr:electron transfer flavoprotein subunit alpha/FixB family protein [Planococcus sp. (in: firmicutes)]